MENIKTDYDYIVLGTGIQESILASALSRNQYSVLHIDANPFYGGNSCSFDLKGLMEWVINVKNNDKNKNSENINTFLNSYSNIDVKLFSGYNSSSLSENEKNVNNEEINNFLTQTQSEIELDKVLLLKELLKENRQYYISLLPKMAYCRGPFIDLIVKADIGNYMEFRSMEKTFIYTDNKFEEVPCTKEDIFNSKQIKVIEKRKLMKFLTFIMSYEEQPELYKDYEDKPFSEFMKNQKLDSKLKEVILQAINDSEDGLENVNTLDGIKSIHRYLKSLGKWGNSPLICPLYGGGSEISQAFCRSCAVFGGVYMLDQEIKSIKFEDSKYKIDCEYKFTGKKLITSIDYINDTSLLEYEEYEKAIIISDKSIHENVDICISVFPPNSINNINRIIAIQQGYNANCCPKSKYILYLCTKATSTSKEELVNVVNTLFDDKEKEKDSSSPNVDENKDGGDANEKDDKTEKETENKLSIEDNQEAMEMEMEMDEEDLPTSSAIPKEKPKAFLSLYYRQAIRKVKKEEGKRRQEEEEEEEETNRTILDDLNPSIDMENQIRQTISLFHELCPDKAEMFVKQPMATTTTEDMDDE